jgi:hypothetical protein
MLTNRLLPALALGALLLAPLAACGHNDETRIGADAAAGSPSSTSLPTTGPVDKDAFVSALLAAIETKHSVHLSVAAGSAGSGQVDVAYRGNATKIKVQAVLTGGRHQLFVIANDVVYIEQGGTGKYAMIDKNDPEYGSLLSTFTEIGPKDSVAGLGAGMTSVVADGTSTVSGKVLRHYRAIVDPSRATGAFKALGSSNAGTDPMQFDLYVDKSDLLRLIEVHTGDGTTSLTLGAWGAPVTIKVPSGSQIVSGGAGGSD